MFDSFAGTKIHVSGECGKALGENWSDRTNLSCYAQVLDLLCAEHRV